MMIVASWYTSALDAALTGDLDLEGGAVTAVLVSESYVFSASHTALSDIPAGAREGTASVTGVNVAGGKVTANPTTWTAATGDPVKGIALLCDGALVAWIDDFGAGPGNTTLALNGSDVTANWHTDGIIRLTLS